MKHFLMRRNTRGWLTMAPALVAGLSVSTIALAAEDEEGKLVLEEVIVSTTKYQEELANQPVSITQFNAEQRNLTATASATDMFRLTPGIEISDRGVTIRGIGRNTATSTLGTTEPVAYYVNGFYMPDSGVIGENTLIGGNVQILRGPQGTRYGTNAIGGAANLISRRPTDTFMGEALLGYGKFDWNTQGATVSGPLSDNYKFRASAQRFNQQERTQKNVGPVEAGYAVDNLYIEAQLEGQVTDNLHFLLRSSTFAYDNKRGYTAPAVYNKAAPFQGSNIPNVTYNYDKDPPNRPYTIDVDVDGYDKLKNNQVHILNVDWDLGATSLYYVGGYQGYVAEGMGDYDGTSRIGFTTGPGNPGGAIPDGIFISTSIIDRYLNDNHRHSHELRWESNPGGALEWNLGLYYGKAHYDQRYAISNPNQPELANPVYRFYNGAVQAGAPIAPNPDRDTYRQHNLLDTKTQAIFAQMTYAFTEKFQMTAGARYTEDVSDGTNEYFSFYWDTSFTGDVTPLVNGARTVVKDHEVTGRLAFDYQATDSTNLYFSVARGSKPSSISLDNIVPDPAQGGRNNIAGPEELIAYELGWKQSVGNFFATVALFFNDYTDMQIPLTVYLPNPISGLDSIAATRYENVDAEIYGIEIEGTWEPVPGAWFRANYTYTHSEYTGVPGLLVDSADPTMPDPNDPTRTIRKEQNIVGNQLARLPEHKASLAGYYTWDFAPGSLILGGYVYYAGERYWSVFNTDTWKIAGYTVANASATWRAPNYRYDVTFNVTNLMDKEYVTAISVAGPDLGLARTRYLGGERNYNLQLRLRF